MKTKITKAFKELRKHGYFARQNFWCCQTCAWASVPDSHGERAVFYHNQDNQELLKYGHCYLSWSGNGKEIVDVLEKHGLQVEWEGTENKRIKIQL